MKLIPPKITPYLIRSNLRALTNSSLKTVQSITKSATEQNTTPKPRHKINSPEYANLIEKKEILYHNTIHFNPDENISPKYLDPHQMAVTKDEIIISTKPLTRIKKEDIKSITHNSIYQMCMRINCIDSITHKMVWAPINPAHECKVSETKKMSKHIKKILEK